MCNVSSRCPLTTTLPLRSYHHVLLSSMHAYMATHNSLSATTSTPTGHLSSFESHTWYSVRRSSPPAGRIMIEETVLVLENNSLRLNHNLFGRSFPSSESLCIIIKIQIRILESFPGFVSLEDVQQTRRQYRVVGSDF